LHADREYPGPLAPSAFGPDAFVVFRRAGVIAGPPRRASGSAVRTSGHQR